jgi:hypothetical protein
MNIHALASRALKLHTPASLAEGQLPGVATIHAEKRPHIELQVIAHDHCLSVVLHDKRKAEI